MRSGPISSATRIDKKRALLWHSPYWPTSNLAVAADGQRLAFVWTDAKTVKRTFALMVLPTAGGEPRELLRTQDPVRIGVPAWTPDSRYIIYARTVTGENGSAGAVRYERSSRRVTNRVHGWEWAR